MDIEALKSALHRHDAMFILDYFDVPSRGPALFPAHLGSRVLAIIGVWRSCNWLDGSPERRLTMRPRFTAGS